MNREQLVELCKNIYFSQDSCSTANLILANGGLYYLFFTYQMFATQPELAECETYTAMCKRNFENLLQGLDLLLPATFESIQALLFGVGPFLFRCYEHRRKTSALTIRRLPMQ